MAIQFDGRSLTPDVAGAFTQGQQSANILQNQRLTGQRTEQLMAQDQAKFKANQQQAQQAQQMQQLTGKALAGDEGELTDIYSRNLEIGEKVSKFLNLKTKEQKGNIEMVRFNLGS